MRLRACFVLLLLPTAALAQAPIGLFTELQVETKVDLLAWPESCGKLPVASRIPGRGTVSADVRGGVLSLRAKKAPVLIRSDACSDPDAAMTRGVPVHAENRWELFCSTPAGSVGARTETLKIVFTPPDGLSTSLVTRFGSECKGTEAVTRVFTRTVPTPAEPVAAQEPGPVEVPDAGVAAPEEGPLDGGELVAQAPATHRAAVARPPDEETVTLPDVELATPEEDDDYLLPVGELRRKGTLAPLLGGVALLLVLGGGAAALLLRRKPLGGQRAGAPAPKGPPPVEVAGDPRAAVTQPMRGPVESKRTTSVEVDPSLGAVVHDPRAAETMQRENPILAKLEPPPAAEGKPRFCPACGKQVPAAARFCPHCRSRMPGEPGSG